MKKVVICNIPMKKAVDTVVYSSKDQSLKVSNTAVRYPVNAFLEASLQSDDDVKVILLVKKDNQEFYKAHTAEFITEVMDVSEKTNAKIEYKIIETEFSEEQSVHESLMAQIVDEIAPKTQITVDMTYGPKDLPIVIFTALRFAEKFLECEIDHIIYGQAFIVDNVAHNTLVYDMVPLYYMDSVINTIHGDNPEKAKQMLKSLLFLGEK